MAIMLNILGRLSLNKKMDPDDRDPFEEVFLICEAIVHLCLLWEATHNMH